MPLTLNTILVGAGVDLRDVLLLRHQDSQAVTGKSLYALWRDERPLFEDYQRRQRADFRSRFSKRIWASFVGAPHGETLFAGLYVSSGSQLSAEPWTAPTSNRVTPAGHDYVFDLALAPELSELIGRLYIDWGRGMRSWVQHAARRDKPVLEVRRELKEPDFPGYGAFIAQLSDLQSLPLSWGAALAASRGVYLLSCPRTNEQYVGSATGAGGFLSRWREYAASGHGGNIALKSRDPSDYRVSILEVAGSAAMLEDILAMEARWKAKLQSREMGLNRN